MQDICELNSRTPATRPKQEAAQNTQRGKKKQKAMSTISRKDDHGGNAAIAKGAVNGAAATSPKVPLGRVGGELGAAGSVDACEGTVANATATSAMAGADRHATADLAGPTSGKRLVTGGAASSATAKNRAERQSSDESGALPDAVGTPDNVPPGDEPLPEDAEAYVDAVHRQVDLVQLEVKLLHSADEKVVQRELACLRELRYGKRAPDAGDEPPQIIFDIPRPQRTE